MIIANPIFDAAFKYLIEDAYIAKGIISRIIGYEILEIDFKPKEYTIFTAKNEMSFIRMDFHAIILTKDNRKQKVLIELQKSKQSLDIVRFRRYIGEEFQRIEEWIEKKNKAGQIVHEPVPYPIIVIYFLGYIENANLPKVVCLKGNYYDVLDEKYLSDVSSDFVELLVHNLYMIQLEKQYEGQNTKPLERLLTLFSQQYQLEKGSRFLDYPDSLASETTTDELVQKSLLRLSSAAQDEEVRRQLQNEEDVERMITNAFFKLEEAELELKEKTKAIEENKKAIEENKKAIEEKTKAIEEKTKAIEENKKVIYSMARLLKKSGLSSQEIHKETGISIEEIDKLGQ